MALLLQKITSLESQYQQNNLNEITENRQKTAKNQQEKSNLVPKQVQKCALNQPKSSDLSKMQQKGEIETDLETKLKESENQKKVEKLQQEIAKMNLKYEDKIYEEEKKAKAMEVENRRLMDQYSRCQQTIQGLNLQVQQIKGENQKLQLEINCQKRESDQSHEICARQCQKISDLEVINQNCADENQMLQIKILALDSLKEQLQSNSIDEVEQIQTFKYLKSLITTQQLIIDLKEDKNENFEAENKSNLEVECVEKQKIQYEIHERQDINTQLLDNYLQLCKQKQEEIKYFQQYIQQLQWDKQEIIDENSQLLNEITNKNDLIVKLIGEANENKMMVSTSSVQSKAGSRALKKQVEDYKLLNQQLINEVKQMRDRESASKLIDEQNLETIRSQLVELNSVKEQLMQQTIKLNNANNELQSAQSLIQQLKSQLSQKENVIRLLQDENNILSEENNSVNLEIQKEIKIMAIGQNIAQQYPEIETKTGHISESKQPNSDDIYQVLQENSHLQSKISDLERENQNILAKYSTLQSENKQLSEKISKLDDLLQKSQIGTQIVQEQLQECKQQFDLEQKQHKAREKQFASEREQFLKDQFELERRIIQYQRETDRSKSEAEMARGSVEGLNRRCQELIEENSRLRK